MIMRFNKHILSMTAAAVLSAGIFSTPALADKRAEHEAFHQRVVSMVATQDIELLRRQYARATDMIGLNTPDSIEAGRAVYRRIFTPDATIRVTNKGNPEPVFTAVGPDAWVKVAADALAVFDNTQHLIGTQLVEIESLPGADDKGGKASMSSYLQAWHDDPDRVLDIFIGTYYDKVQYTPGIGWQIYDMTLEKVSGEVTDKK